MTKNQQKLKDYYSERLNADIPLSFEEWGKLSRRNKEIYEECVAEKKIKEVALLSYFLSDTLKGGTLAVEAVWDILPETTQDAYIKKWGKINAQRSE